MGEYLQSLRATCHAPPLRGAYRHRLLQPPKIQLVFDGGTCGAKANPYRATCHAPPLRGAFGIACWRLRRLKIVDPVGL
jgi:hypothetical protein